MITSCISNSCVTQLNLTPKKTQIALITTLAISVITLIGGVTYSVLFGHTAAIIAAATSGGLSIPHIGLLIKSFRSEVLPEQLHESFSQNQIDTETQEREQFKVTALQTYASQSLRPQMKLPENMELPQSLEEIERFSPDAERGQGSGWRWVNYSNYPDVLVKSTYRVVNHSIAKIIDSARQVIEENHLYLLYVPTTLEISEDVLWQEKCPILGNWDFQEGLYHWGTTQPELEPYMKELYKQLAMFICLTGWQDCKYDNIPIMEDGRIALFDLEDINPLRLQSPEIGLMHGRATEQVGLFHFVPESWVDEVADHIATNFQVDRNEAKRRARERNQYLEAKEAFHQRAGIQTPNQRLTLTDELTLPLTYKARKRALIKRINKKIAKTHNFEPLFGRKFFIGINTGRSLQKALCLHYHDLEQFLEQALSDLKRDGYIFDYTIDMRYHTVTVEC